MRGSRFCLAKEIVSNWFAVVAPGDVMFQYVGTNLMALTGGPVRPCDPNVPSDLAVYTKGWVPLETLVTYTDLQTIVPFKY